MSASSSPAAAAAGRSSLTILPYELLLSIVSHLPNRDIKNLRLTCSFLRDKASLRLDRVFLSANPRNIQVFREIAYHEAFRKGIIEIVWDDARLIDSNPRWEDAHPEDFLDTELLLEDSSDNDNGCPEWFSCRCEENLEFLRRRRHSDVDRPDHLAREQQVASLLPLRKSWEYYQWLLQQQHDVLGSGADVEALKLGLQQFPSLSRITITPAAHGWLFEPLYETPMIRNLPYGFNYPIPRGWPVTSFADSSTSSSTPEVVTPWGDDGSEEERNKWRGFRVITRVLAQHQQHQQRLEEEDEEQRQSSHHHISELVIDTNQLSTGLNCRIFEQPCPEYEDLVSLLQRPGFRRLDLALLIGEQDYFGWPAFRHGYFRRALAESADLEHMSLSTDVNCDLVVSVEHFIPLQTVLPVDQWPRLRHLGLSGFLVMQADVMALLAALPPTVRSVELSFLYFLDGGGNYKSLLDEMHDSLGWRDRLVQERPQVSIRVEHEHPMAGRNVWLDDEVMGFLYDEQPNPFDFGKGDGKNRVFATGVVKDAFRPEHERPNTDNVTLMNLGYIKKVPWLMEAHDRFLQRQQEIADGLVGTGEGGQG